MKDDSMKQYPAARAHRAAGIPAALGLALALSLSLGACSQRTELGGNPGSGIETRAASAVNGELVKDIEFSGVLAPAQVVTLVSKLGGQAINVGPELGASVQEGELLLLIDAKELNAQARVAESAVSSVRDQIEQAELAISQAKSSLDLSRKSFERTKALFDSQSASQSQLDDAQNKLDLARMSLDNAIMRSNMLKGSSLAQAQAQANLIEVQISNSRLTSPVSGIIVTKSVNRGEMVSAGAPLMTVADTRTFKLQGNIAQDALPLIAADQPVVVHVDGLPGELAGRITQVGPMAAASGQYFPVVVSLANNHRLMAGMTASARFSLKASQSLIVPRSAVQRSNGLASVFVIKDGHATARRVEPGLENRESVQILSGLSAGEVVAASNVGMIHDGNQVVAQ
jgi:RND family efflux transporter MFP subunit